MSEITKRWMHPETELNLNKAKLQATTQSQYSGNDDVNGVMWLLKKKKG